jgi:hypothetical protein
MGRHLARQVALTGRPCPQISWLRRTLGDRAAIAVFVNSSELDVDKIEPKLATFKAAFPEADQQPHRRESLVSAFRRELQIEPLANHVLLFPSSGHSQPLQRPI